MAKHKHWYQGNSLKCRICQEYPWDSQIIEEREWRPCLSQKSIRCKKKVFGYKTDRICNDCTNSLKNGNLI